jgi:hypothetical protein
MFHVWMVCLFGVVLQSSAMTAAGNEPVKPVPDAIFKQLHIGANGPSSIGASTFESRSDVMDSWVARSLTPKQLGDIFNQVNFEKQILVSLSYGKRINTTGTIHVADVRLNSKSEVLTISGRIGVNEEDCKNPHADSYPFALAVASRPERVPAYPGYFIQNFPDGCKSVMSGTTISGNR